jgi:hypothetical protein
MPLLPLGKGEFTNIFGSETYTLADLLEALGLHVAVTVK